MKRKRLDALHTRLFPKMSKRLKREAPQILLERQSDGNIYLWVNVELIDWWKGRHTHLRGKPLELARAIQKAFAAVYIDATLELDDPTE